MPDKTLISSTIGSALAGAILTIFGLKRQIIKEIQGVFTIEAERLDKRIEKLEEIDILTVPAHKELCHHNSETMNILLEAIKEKMGSNQLLIIEKIDNLASKVNDCPHRRE